MRSMCNAVVRAVCLLLCGRGKSRRYGAKGVIVVCLDVGRSMTPKIGPAVAVVFSTRFSLLWWGCFSVGKLRKIKNIIIVG